MGIRLIGGLWPPLMLWNATQELMPWIDIAMAHERELPPAERISAIMLAARLKRHNGDWAPG